MKMKVAGQLAGLAGHVVAERIRQPRPTLLGEVPPSVDALTNEWLTAALCRDTPGAWVTDFSTGSGSDGSTSRRALRISYNNVGVEAGLPAAVYSKSTPHFSSRAITVPSKCLECEAIFYDRIRPCLDIEAPVAYYTTVDPRSGRSMFLLEDVAETKGVEFGDPIQHHIDRKRAEAIAITLAGVHGTFWESARFAGDLKALKTAEQWQTDANNLISFSKRSMTGFGRATSVFPDKFIDQRDRVWAAVMQSLALHREQPATLLHADVHSRNWYLTPDGGMGLYDWQVLNVGTWAMDLAYALVSALTVADRREWERDLVGIYLEHLHAAGGPQIDFDRAFLTYRQQAFHGLAFWLYTIGTGRLEPAMQPTEVSLANLERMSNMIVDLDSFAALET
jgi:aminoglycoside phosphotransferase (APT) family kinase protein